MDKTEANLQAAFSGEAQAYLRYTLFAIKADEEGFTQYARLFRAAAEGELIHARNHFNVMGGVGSTKDNLLAAATCEHLEMTRFYPGIIDQAREDRNDKAVISFSFSLKAEEGHNPFFEKALEAIKSSKTAANESYFVCHTCGNLAAGAIPAKCPGCGSAASQYKPVV
jgi:rubrerythrin